MDFENRKKEYLEKFKDLYNNGELNITIDKKNKLTNMMFNPSNELELNVSINALELFKDITSLALKNLYGEIEDIDNSLFLNYIEKVLRDENSNDFLDNLSSKEEAELIYDVIAVESSSSEELALKIAEKTGLDISDKFDSTRLQILIEKTNEISNPVSLETEEDCNRFIDFTNEFHKLYLKRVNDEDKEKELVK